MIVAGLAPERIVVIGDLTRSWQRFDPAIESDLHALPGGLPAPCHSKPRRWYGSPPRRHRTRAPEAFFAKLPFNLLRSFGIRITTQLQSQEWFAFYALDDVSFLAVRSLSVRS